MTNQTQIIDVRTPEEYESGHSPGSINIPLQYLVNELNRLDPNKTLLLCCKSGARSEKALELLKAHGFKNVYNVGAWDQMKPIPSI